MSSRTNDWNTWMKEQFNSTTMTTILLITETFVWRTKYKDVDRRQENRQLCHQDTSWVGGRVDDEIVNSRGDCWRKQYLGVEWEWGLGVGMQREEERTINCVARTWVKWGGQVGARIVGFDDCASTDVHKSILGCAVCTPSDYDDNHYRVRISIQNFWIKIPVAHPLVQVTVASHFSGNFSRMIRTNEVDNFTLPTVSWTSADRVHLPMITGRPKWQISLLITIYAVYATISVIQAVLVHFAISL
jgi:hypothetical protein